MKKEPPMITKAIVETVGSFEYVDLATGSLAEGHRPSVVQMSPFIQTKINDGKIKLILGDLPKEANNKDFLTFWKESGGDIDLASQSYASTFGKTAEKKPAPPAGSPAKPLSKKEQKAADEAAAAAAKAAAEKKPELTPEEQAAADAAAEAAKNAAQ